MLSIEDLFAFGLGCDIVGGYLVARGLLAPAPILTRRATTFPSFNATVMVSQAEDRARGFVGMLALLFGFSVQAAGYAAVAGGAEVKAHGAVEVLGVLLAALLPVVVVSAVERWQRPPTVRRLLLCAAHFDVNSDTMQDAPSWLMLYQLGIAAYGKTRREGESNEEYARRVWDVDRIRDD